MYIIKASDSLGVLPLLLLLFLLLLLSFSYSALLYSTLLYSTLLCLLYLLYSTMMTGLLTRESASEFASSRQRLQQTFC